MKPVKFDIQKLAQEYNKVRKRLPTIAGATSVTFFKSNFRRQGFVSGGRLERWQPRSPDAKRNRGRAILVDSGRMRRSIRVMQKTDQFVNTGTNDPKAEAHNEGADLTGTVRVSAFRKKSHRVKAHTKQMKSGKRRVRAHTRSATKVKGHSRRMNTRIPKRQFIGHSEDVMKAIERAYFRDVENIFINTKID